MKSLRNKKNALLRYKAIQEEFLKHKNEDIPLTRVWRNYIYPKFFISKTTLYNILGTPIEKELKQILEVEEKEKKEKRLLELFSEENKEKTPS
ncbi:hypothetical protein [Flavobacterium columnare]|uniref:hypothetical protein n=1 Tax=Flavobacterium columnare TaxID=996 RepID=UPI000D1BCD95|nr:hypothetical protein [Flavobacterium columnare]PTD14381.1 hypothetical protein C6N29_07990 [Flavobacterium columnare]